MYHQRFEEPFATWSGGGDFSRFLYVNISEFWRHAEISRSEAVRELEVGYDRAVADFKVSARDGETTLEEQIRNSPTDGLIVVQRDRILFEDYSRMTPTDVHAWWSVSSMLRPLFFRRRELRGVLARLA
jgi:hypothetical protein